MGSDKWLKVDLDLLQSGLQAARQAHAAIAATAAGYDNLSDAVGHRTLNSTLDDFGGNWAVHRRRLLDELDTLAGNIAHTYEKFDHEDVVMSQGGERATPSPGDTQQNQQPQGQKTEPVPPTPPPAPGPTPAPTPAPAPVPAPSSGSEGAASAPVEPAPVATPPGESGHDKSDTADTKTPGLPPTVNPDTASFTALLDVWSNRAEALVKLGLPITALGAGAVALLALFSRLPEGYHLNPDGTVTRRADGTPTGTLDPKAAESVLGGFDGQHAGSATGDQPMTAADVDGLLSGANDPTPGETGDGEGDPAVPVEPAATDPAATDPASADSGVAASGSPSAPAEPVSAPLVSPTDPLASDSSAGGSASSGTPVMPAPPLEGASPEAHAAMGEATQRLDQLAAPAAAAATLGAATLRGSDAEAALAAVRQEQAAQANSQSAAQTRMAAMSSLSAVSHQLSQATGSGTPSGQSASVPGSATRRSASEALETLEKPTEGTKKDEAK